MALGRTKRSYQRRRGITARRSPRLLPYPPEGQLHSAIRRSWTSTATLVGCLRDYEGSLQRGDEGNAQDQSESRCVVQ